MSIITYLNVTICFQNSAILAILWYFYSSFFYLILDEFSVLYEYSFIGLLVIIMIHILNSNIYNA